MSAAIQALINAVNLGSLFALYALGVSIVFGILRLINFAHASLIMVAGYTMVLAGGLPLAVRLALTVVVCIGLAVLLELVVFRTMRGASPATLLVASFAVTILLSSLAETIFGQLPVATDVSPTMRESWRFGTIYLPKLNVITLIVTAMLLVGLVVFLRRTAIGLHMRAAAEDFQTARLLGVKANRVISVAFGISGVLAAAAAVLLLGQSGSVTPQFGIDAVLFGMIAAVVGGLDSLKGAALGGFALGAVSQTLQAVLPLELRPFRDAFLFLAVFIILVVRPQGLIGGGQGVRV